MNSAIFFALTFQYKWRYKFSDTELATMIQESLSLKMIQLFLTALILFYSQHSLGLEKDEEIEMRSQFSTQIAHFLVCVVIH